MNFKIIDPAIGFSAGAIIAFTAAQVIPQSLHPVLGMFLGGVVGMAMKLALTLLLAPFFGAFEVMIPLSLIGMSVGMFAPMLLPTAGLWPTTLMGAELGLALALIVMYSNHQHTGKLE